MKKIKILVVDDDTDILMIIRYCLKSASDFELKCVISGQEAISIAMEMEPDLIILDVMMPEMDGVATLKAMKLIPKLAHIPIIFLTAKVKKEEIEEYFRLGICEVIIKPFDPLSLPATLRKIVQGLGIAD